MKELHDAREQAIKPLADLLARRSALARQLAELDGPYGAAYATAEAAGWTAGELTALGADAPVKRPKGRARGRTGPRKSATAAAVMPEQNGSPTSEEPVIAGTSA